MITLVLTTLRLSFFRFALAAIAAFGVLDLDQTHAQSDSTKPAKSLFGAKPSPADLRPRAIGFYSRGCLAGGQALPVDGPYWQAMRLSRNRNWGHPDLINYLQWLAKQVAEKDGWPGLLVGDLSQPRGGPMLTGHRSHQVGLDADVWLTPMPNRRLSKRQRETMSAVAVVEPGPHTVKPNVWTDAHFRLIKRAASHRGVERVLVAPGIKKKLCETETGNRAWLRKVRPYWGHNYHMHIRMACPRGSRGCQAQKAPAAGDGCGAQLAWWYTDEPYRPADPKAKPKPRRELRMSDLPSDCSVVLAAGTARGVTGEGSTGRQPSRTPTPKPQ